MKKRRYAAVGTGGRIPMFIDPIAGKYSDSAQLVGLCDSSATRREWHRQRLGTQYGARDIPVYGAEDFERMLDEQKPDAVIVCVPDHLHDNYIVRSLDHGIDVISEKPLATDADKCRAIFEAVRRTKRGIRTAFNCRWMPGASKIREIIAAGAIGKVVHVDFEYMLNTSHGADYFRRWHSYKALSGGLLVHKSTHHFDLINWWADAIPESVYALGRLAFYGRENAIARGQGPLTRYPRYTGEPLASDDPFALRLDEDSTMDALYRKAEKESGYVRDENVFREGITIEDTMSVMVNYRTGVVANYSLNAFCPCEGYRVSITGDGGRLEYREQLPSHILTGDASLKIAESERHEAHLTLQPLFSAVREVPIPKADGNHGGGDALLQEQMFSAHPPSDPLGRTAGHEQGAASALIGIAANRAMETGLPVRISDLLELAPGTERLSELA